VRDDRWPQWPHLKSSIGTPKPIHSFLHATSFHNLLIATAEEY
jgi:hypothetical protein